MEYTEHYDNLEQRNNLCSAANGNGFTMLHDDFDKDWKRGDEPHGILTFTDEPAPIAPLPQPTRDPLTEIDEINAKIADYNELKARVKSLEKK